MLDADLLGEEPSQRQRGGYENDREAVRQQRARARPRQPPDGRGLHVVDGSRSLLGSCAPPRGGAALDRVRHLAARCGPPMSRYAAG